MRIGIVDDHPLFRLGLRQALERRAGVDVLWDVGSAIEARRVVIQDPVDVVLMDVNLGGVMDGVAMTRSILRGRAAVRVVMISASVDEHLVFAAMQAGAAGYLAKDLHPDEFMRSLRKCLNGPGAAVDGRSNDLMERFKTGRGTTGARRWRSRLGRLTLREIQVLTEIRAGRTNRGIAARLGISETTVNKHVHHILDKVKARNRAQAATLLSQLEQPSEEEVG